MTAFYLYFCDFHVTGPIPIDPFSKKNCPLPGEIIVYTIKVKVKVKVTQLDSESSLTLCDCMDYTVHGIFQARILEWIAIPFSRGSSQPRDRTLVSCIAGDFFWATREALTIKGCPLSQGAKPGVDGTLISATNQEIKQSNMTLSSTKTTRFYVGVFLLLVEFVVVEGMWQILTNYKIKSSLV